MQQWGDDDPPDRQPSIEPDWFEAMLLAVSILMLPIIVFLLAIELVRPR